MSVVVVNWLRLHLSKFLLLWMILEWDRSWAQQPAAKVPRKYHEDHRTIQWCLNGVDEPEMNMYPWSEFSPILQRRYYKEFSANVRFKYNIDLRPVRLKGQEGAKIGLGQYLLQRAHFVFSARLRREFRYNVKTSYNDSIIEGLLVQVNMAPMGDGIPANAQFLDPREFNCGDCEQPVGMPIACRKRTYFHTIHPTVLAYHHRMPFYQKERERRTEYCKTQLIPFQCILVGFEDLFNENGARIGQPSLPGLNDTLIMYEWKDFLKDQMGRPHPEITDTCQATADCEDIFNQWFKRSCCVKEDQGFCNKPQPATTTDPTASTSTQAPVAVQNMTAMCPNRPYQAKQGFPGHDATKYDENATIFSEPRGQSYDWPRWECRPFYTTVCRTEGYENKASAPWDTQEKLKTDYTIQGEPPAAVPTNPFDPATQCCQGVAPGQPCPTAPPNQPPLPGVTCPLENPTASPAIVKTQCIPRVVLPYNQETDEEAPEPDITKCEDKWQGEYFPPTSSVHGNLVWYFPPCQYASTVRFQMLVVHSFSKGLYSIVESDVYYDLKQSPVVNDPLSQEAVNIHIPSPLFTGFQHECEAATSSNFLYSTSDPRTNFEYSRSYDACIQEVGDSIHHQMCKGVPAFSALRSRSNPVPRSHMPKCDPQAAYSKHRECDGLCDELMTTTRAAPTTPSWHPIKRSLHGAINIITNFCVMPICVFIARFYKETYNLQSFKGARTWFWMHMVGSGGSTVLMYMGYFSERLVDLGDPHVVYGNIYIVFLGLSYVTSWMRHKKRLISSIMEIIHSVGGYGCLVLALFCVTNATKKGVPIPEAVKLLVYIALCSLIVFYLGMTIHICSLDKKFGMKPRRWHFPIVESRFEDLPVPHRRVRQFFLFALLFVNLPLTISTLFL